MINTLPTTTKMVSWYIDVINLLYFITGNVGGLISLFLGLNLINLFEILYIMIKMVSNYIVHMFDKI